VKQFGAQAHLPIQNREKISPKISSTSTRRSAFAAKTSPPQILGEQFCGRLRIGQDSFQGLRRGLKSFAMAFSRDQARMAAAHRRAREIFHPLDEHIDILPVSALIQTPWSRLDF